MAQETSKQRWNRIELDYYKGRGASARWRSWSALLVLLGAAAWLILAPSWDATGGLSPRLFQTKRLASPGPLARPHASFESRCEACHTDFEPINASRWSPIPAPADRDGNAKCQSCHPGAMHHSSQIPEDVGDCTSCHRDHKGREASLTRIEDTACTRCHAELLDGHTKTKKEEITIANTVTRFDRDHPEFAWMKPDAAGSMKRDPGRLKFNHRVHLTPGMNPQLGGLPLKTYAALSEQDRPRYGWKPGDRLDGVVALDCVHCHRLQSEPRAQTAIRGGAPPHSEAFARSSGDAMLPVTFENDCRSCHPLPFDPNLPGEVVRHGIQPKEIVGELRQLYGAQAVREDPDLLKRPVPRTVIPGNRYQAKVVTVNQAIEAKVTSAIRMLLANGKGGCTECHILNSPAARAIRSSDAGSLVIEEVQVPEVWFRRAKFDHSAHRALQCASCHEQAGSSKESGDILLPGIKTCLQCHAPTTEHATGVTGGAGFGCTECHRHHGIDEPSQGRGVPSRTPGSESLKTIREFLDGVQHHPGPSIKPTASAPASPSQAIVGESTRM